MKSVCTILIVAFLFTLPQARADQAEEYRLQTLEIERVHSWNHVDEDDVFITDQIGSPEYQNKFFKEICHLPPDKTKWAADQKKTCERKLVKTLNARLAKYYFAADMKNVQLTCDADPFSCQKKHDYEVILRKSHNEKIDEIREDKLAELSNHKPPEKKAKWKRVGAAMLQEMGRSLQHRQETNQTCKSRPDGTGGFISDCTSY